MKNHKWNLFLFRGVCCVFYVNVLPNQEPAKQTRNWLAVSASVLPTVQSDGRINLAWWGENVIGQFHDGWRSWRSSFHLLSHFSGFLFNFAANMAATRSSLIPLRLAPLPTCPRKHTENGWNTGPTMFVPSQVIRLAANANRLISCWQYSSSPLGWYLFSKLFIIAIVFFV